MRKIFCICLISVFVAVKLHAMPGVKKQTDLSAADGAREFRQRLQETLLVCIDPRYDLKPKRPQRIRHVLGVVPGIKKPRPRLVFGIADHERDSFVRVCVRAPGEKKEHGRENAQHQRRYGRHSPGFGCLPKFRPGIHLVNCLSAGSKQRPAATQAYEISVPQST